MVLKAKSRVYIMVINFIAALIISIVIVNIIIIIVDFQNAMHNSKDKNWQNVINQTKSKKQAVIIIIIIITWCHVNSAIRVAVGLRLGCALCEAHRCPCGATADPLGQHALTCKKNPGRRFDPGSMAVWALSNLGRDRRPLVN